jgi:hypothetical protein
MRNENGDHEVLEVQSAWGGAYHGMCIDLNISQDIPNEMWEEKKRASCRLDRHAAENLVKCIQAAYAEADARELERKKSELANKLVETLDKWDRENQCFSDNDLIDIVSIKDTILEKLVTEEVPF